MSPYNGVPASCLDDDNFNRSQTTRVVVLAVENRQLETGS